MKVETMNLRDFHECLSFPNHIVSGFQSLPSDLVSPKSWRLCTEGSLGEEGLGAKEAPSALRYVADGVAVDDGELRYLLSSL